MTLKDGTTILLTRTDAVADLLELAARHLRAGHLHRIDIHHEGDPGSSAVVSSCHLRYAPGAPLIELRLPGIAREQDEDWDSAAKTPVERPGNP